MASAACVTAAWVALNFALASANPPRDALKRSIAAICALARSSAFAIRSTASAAFPDLPIWSIFLAILSKTAPVLSCALMTAFASIIFASINAALNYASGSKRPRGYASRQSRKLSAFGGRRSCFARRLRRRVRLRGRGALAHRIVGPEKTQDRFFHIACELSVALLEDGRVLRFHQTHLDVLRDRLRTSTMKFAPSRVPAIV